MLRVKQVGSHGGCDEVGNDDGQQQRHPAKEKGDCHRKRDMQHEGDQAVIMFARAVEERGKAHPVKENEKISEQDRQRMAHEQIFETLARRGILKLLFRHDGKRANVGAAQFAIVAVMIIMRTAPNGTGTNNANTEKAHENFGQVRPGQNRAMLLVVINHKQPD